MTKKEFIELYAEKGNLTKKEAEKPFLRKCRRISS